MNVFEITIQRGMSGRWPVVAEQTADGAFLPVRTEGALQINLEEFQKQLNSTASPQEYGTLLGQALFRDDVRDAFVRALPDNNDPLHVLLSVEADELRGLRWERLCGPLEKRWAFLSLDQRVPFCLYLPSATDRHFPPIGRLDLRALIVAANPKGLERYRLPSFDAPAAVRGIRASLGEIPHAVLGEGDGAVGPPTLDALCEWITAEAFSLLHLVCHGCFQSGKKETLLYLAGADGQVDPVTATRFLNRLAKLRGARGLPQLVFLSTCESAVSEAGSALAGLAQRLVRELGMPAVLAMTEPVTVATAQALAEAFYQRLRQHGHVDRALSEACAGLAERSDVHVPVLYSRLGGRPLFSDAPDRPLTVAEIKHGTTRVRELFNERAPAWLQRENRPCSLFDELTGQIERTLHVEFVELAPEQKRERREALDNLSNLCGEAIERTFTELALGKEPPPYDARCPFRGLYPFRVDDHEFFFGREELVEHLIGRLAEAGFLAVLGPSGSGKSSLVLAGVVPALQRKNNIQLAYMTPGSNPLDFLEAVLQANPEASLLVVDQFEEIFTLCTDPGQRAAFLGRVLKLREQMKVILTMRADFWGDCAPYRELKDLIQARQELIAPMDAAELRSQMEKQAAMVGLRFEADLAATILEEVAGEPGSMPLLQHALRELWKRRHGRWLRAEEYRAVGGVKKALSETADGVYGELPEREQGRMRDILIRLTRLDETTLTTTEHRDTRQRVKLEELTPSGGDPVLTKTLVKRLADARLVVTSRNAATGEEQVEVAHEALIRYWPRLRGWLDEDRVLLRARESIGEAAQAWISNSQDDGYLLHRGKPLENAEALLGQARFPLNQQEHDYIHACTALRERERVDRIHGSRKRLEEWGWGVIFAHDADPAIHEALQELLAHRRSQATKIREHYYREFTGESGYRPGDSKRTFLARQCIDGPPDPDKMPYYLLIVGDPETIPYAFQYQLDVQYAVGRIYFNTAEEYARYAKSVVTAETRSKRVFPRSAFFNPVHPGDPATNYSNDYLVCPMVTALTREYPDWEFNLLQKEDATKAALGSLFETSRTPALLFAACHGLAYRADHDHQLDDQGALLCQDWSGFGKIDPRHTFTAQDIPESADLRGSVCFLLASYSAGCPHWADQGFGNSQERKVVAPRAFVASLPQRLLSSPGGGALAAIGLIGPGWFFPLQAAFAKGNGNKANYDISLFLNSVRRLLDGYPVGSALECFSQRAGELALELNDALEEARCGKVVDDQELSRLRVAANDARTYVIVGDPAVRIRTSGIRG